MSSSLSYMTGMPLQRQQDRSGRYLCQLALALVVATGIVIGLVEWVGIKTGSTLSPAALAAEQAADPNLLVLPSDIRHWGALKVARIAQEQPEVVLICSSRGNQLRSAMMKPYKFYNAALTAWSVQQVIEMFERTVNVAKPRVVMFCLDYFMLTDVWERSSEKERSMNFDNVLYIKYQAALNLVRTVFKQPGLMGAKVFDILRSSGTPTGKNGQHYLTIDAVRVEGGFRYDGSYQYDAGILSIAAEQIKNNRGLIEAMPGGTRIDTRQIKAVERLAELARRSAVQLVAVQFPILKASLDHLDNDPGYRPLAGNWRDYHGAEMSAKLDALGIPLFDLSRMTLSADTQSFIDAAHPTEAAVLKGLIQLARNPQFRAILPLLEPERLEQELEATTRRGEFVHVYADRF